MLCIQIICIKQSIVYICGVGWIRVVSWEEKLFHHIYGDMVSPVLSLDHKNKFWKRADLFPSKCTNVRLNLGRHLPFICSHTNGFEVSHSYDYCSPLDPAIQIPQTTLHCPDYGAKSCLDNMKCQPYHMFAHTLVSISRTSTVICQGLHVPDALYKTSIRLLNPRRLA